MKRPILFIEPSTLLGQRVANYQKNLRVRRARQNLGRPRWILPGGEGERLFVLVAQIGGCRIPRDLIAD